MLIIDQLMDSCMHCLPYLADCGSIYAKALGLWKIDDIYEKVGKA